MASKMRWSAADRKEFAKMRKNFNAKITRLKEKDPGIEAFLPKELKITDIYSRADFKRAKKRASMFTERGSEKQIKFHGVDVPEFFKKDVQYMAKVENARRGQRRKQFTEERGTRSMAKEAEFSPMRLKGRKSAYDLIRAKERLEAIYTDKAKSERNAAYAANYIKAIRDKLGPLGEPIIDLLKNLTPDQIAKAIELDYEFSIDFVYDYIDAVIKAEALFNRWYGYLSNIKPYQYPKSQGEDLFDSYYGDIQEGDFDEVTMRSAEVRGMKGASWTDLAPDEIKKAMELKEKAHAKYTKKRGKRK